VPRGGAIPPEITHILAFTAEGARLCARGEEPEKGFLPDFRAGSARHRGHAARKTHPLAKAAGCGKGALLRVLDLTAGFGRDAFMLASLGCEVAAAERCAPVFVLLADALARGREDPELAPALLRIRALHGEGADILARLESGDPLPDGPPPGWRPEAIYLDPMYPRRFGRSARPRREMALLQGLAGPDEDAAALLELARRAAPRVVVKRPPRAAPLAEDADRSLASKMVRYDVYLRAGG